MTIRRSLSSQRPGCDWAKSTFFSLFVVLLAALFLAGPAAGQQPKSISFVKADAGLTDVAFGGASSITDINGDGNQDLLITSEQSTKLYLGDGQGGFTEAGADLPAQDVPSNSAPIADVNGDGHEDVLLTGEQPAGLYLGDGEGGFVKADAGILTGGAGAIADLNEDGKQDIVIASTTTTNVYLGDGQGGFSKTAGLKGVTLGSGPFVSIKDVDKDGFSDILLTGGAGSRGITTLYLGNGEGGFTKANAGLTGVLYSSTSIGDVNGDGRLDLLITGQNEFALPSTTLYLGNVEGGFKGANAGLTNALGGSNSIADVNGDGNKDILVTGQDGIDSSITTLYLGDGQGNFTEADAGLNSVSNGSTSIADVNGDGKKDILITGDGSATLYLNQGSGTTLSTPTSLTATAGNGQVDLTWNAGGDSSPSGYNIYRSPSSFSDLSNAKKLNGSLLSSTSYPDAAVTNGTKYFYRVTAVGSSGNESAPSSEVSATPVALTDQVWATVEDGSKTYEVHVVSSQPFSDLQSRALNQQLDEDALRHIYVTDGSGAALKGHKARQLLFEVQSARKAASSDSQLKPALEDFGILPSDLDKLERNTGPFLESYTAWTPATTSDLVRRLFTFLPNPGNATPGAPAGDFAAGIDLKSNRKDLYVQVLLDAVLQPLKPDPSDNKSLEDALSVLAASTSLGEEASNVLLAIKSGADQVLASDVQTTLKNFESTTTLAKYSKHLGQAASALGGITTALKIKDDVVEYVVLSTLANAQAERRLEMLERWAENGLIEDPALRSAIGEIQTRFDDFINDTWYGELADRVEAAANPSNVVGLASFSTAVAKYFGAVSSPVATAFAPWFASFALADFARNQNFAVARATLAGTAWKTLLMSGRISDLQSRLQGQTLRRTDMKELIGLSNIGAYLSVYYYDRYLKISSNAFANAVGYTSSWLELGPFSNYSSFINHLEDRRRRARKLLERTDPPYHFAEQTYLFGNEDQEYQFLLSHLRGKVPNLSNSPSLAADFSVSPSQGGTAPFEVSFSDESVGQIDNWTWRFGDGTTHSGPNPSSKTYETSGTYSVTLTVSTSSGTTDQKTIPVAVDPPPTTVSFSAVGGSGGTSSLVKTTGSLAKATGTVPHTVSFTNSSSGENLSYTWLFGDGTRSREAEPSHTYQHAGQYTVTLKVHGSGGDKVVVSKDLVVTDGPAGEAVVQTNAKEAGYILKGPRTFIGSGRSSSFSDVPAGDYDAIFYDTDADEAPSSETTKVTDGTSSEVSGSYSFGIVGAAVYPQSGGDGDPVQELTVEATPQGGSNPRTAKSASDGRFDLDVKDETTYEVAATGVPGDPKGINILDALEIQKRILGRTSFSSFQRRVADTDGNGSVNILDALEIQKRILGRIQTFPAGQFRGEKATVTVSGAGRDLGTFRIAATGDANFDGSFSPGGSSSSLAVTRTGEGAVSVSNGGNGAEGRKNGGGNGLQPGESFEVPIRVGQSIELGAYQLSVDYPAEMVDFQGASGPNDKVKVLSQGETVRLAWFDREGGRSPVSVEKGQAIATLRFKVGGELEESGQFRLENMTGKLGGPKGKPLSDVKVEVPTMRFGPPTPESFSLKGNVPNPFRKQTMLRMEVPEKGLVTVAVYDALGRQVAKVKEELRAGYDQAVKIGGQQLGSGKYFYRVQAEIGGETLQESGQMTVIR